MKTLSDMKKLLILQGPPASGKSTWVTEYTKELETTEEHLTYKIVSRDEIRHSFGEYNMEHENDVTRIEYSEMECAMKDDINIIINDATNLNPKTLKKLETLAEQYDYNVEYKLFYIPYKEAIKRDQNPDRKHHVGQKVIKRFYRNYFQKQLDEESKQTIDYPRINIDNSLPHAVICDIDGTVAWMQDRSPYDRTTVSTDKADPRMFQLLQILMDADVYILFVSGREGTEQCRRDTEEWIKQYLINYHVNKISGEYDKFMLFMRKPKDYRPDEIIKKEIYENQIKDNFDIVAVFDDRNKVVNMWRNIGMLCCQVNDGDF